MNAQEAMDDAVQSMRDQGIADACAGRAARYWLTLGSVFTGDRANVKTIRKVRRDTEEYRSAFAYARAYEANK